MKLATWNVNSIRARQQRLIDWLRAAQPEVLCLQELKCTDAEFPALELKTAGYHSASYGQRSYNGAAIVPNLPLDDVVRGMRDARDPRPGVIAATAARAGAVRAYAPTGQAVDSPACEYKLQWYDRLRRPLDAHFDNRQPLVL